MIIIIIIAVVVVIIIIQLTSRCALKLRIVREREVCLRHAYGEATEALCRVPLHLFLGGRHDLNAVCTV